MRKCALNFLVNCKNTSTIHLKFLQEEKTCTALTANEIAGFVSNNSMKFDAFRFVELSDADGKFTFINELNLMYDLMHYALMFSNEDVRWSTL